MEKDTRTVYQRVTDQIIQKLKEGTVPWHKPWRTDAAPQNLISKKPYRGINTLLLSMSPYNSPYWLTFKQAKDKGGSVKRGEHGQMVVFWKFLNKEEEIDGKIKKRRIPLLRHYTVFNLEQCEGIKAPENKGKDLDFKPITKCEGIINDWQDSPPIIHTGHQACYFPIMDKIHMPEVTKFESEEEYYSTLFHEMVHSTGHSSRLDRGLGVSRFGDERYSKEELIAEIGAAMLCGTAGIENRTIDNSAAYIASWLRKLEEDPKLMVQAAGKAQRAADLILGHSYGPDAEE